jgi:hypothetical protein
MCHGSELYLEEKMCKWPDSSIVSAPYFSVSGSSASQASHFSYPVGRRGNSGDDDDIVKEMLFRII